LPEESAELNLVLVIDTLGKRYGLLPSQVMREANTFDIFIMDAAITYENHQHEKALNKNKKLAAPKTVAPITDEKMLEEYKKFKENPDANKGRSKKR